MMTSMLEPEAFRRRKNRFRALMHAFRIGKAVPPTPRGRRSDGQLPPIQSQGRWHRENLLRRLRRLEARGISPTAEENNQAINLEQPINHLDKNYPPSTGDVPSTQSRGGSRFDPRRRAANLGRPDPSATGDADSEGPHPSSVDDPMEVDAPPEPTADESPDEEVVLESGMVPDYDLPDYDE